MVLSFGRLSWEKGLDRVIAALVEAPAVRVVMAGDDAGGLNLGGLGVRRQTEDQDAVPAADTVQAQGLPSLVVEAGGAQSRGDGLAHGGAQGRAARG